MGSLKETRRQQKFQVGQWLPRKSSATKVGQLICGQLPGRQFICRQWKSLNGPLQPQLCHIQTFLSFWRVQLRPFMEAQTFTWLKLQAHHDYVQQAHQFKLMMLCRQNHLAIKSSLTSCSLAAISLEYVTLKLDQKCARLVLQVLSEAHQPIPKVF